MQGLREVGTPHPVVYVAIFGDELLLILIRVKREKYNKTFDENS